jgi:hypothetical protein
MRSARLIVLAALLLLAPASAQAKEGRFTGSCEGANSGGSFSGAFADRTKNIVVGPLSLPWAAGHTDVSPATINRFGGDKLPVLLREGRTAKIRTAKALRGGEAVPLGEANFPIAGHPARTLRFAGCPRGKAKNVVDGIPVTFWMLWISVRAPVCVYLDISIDGKPARKRTMSMGAGACPRRAAV